MKALVRFRASRLSLAVIASSCALLAIFLFAGLASATPISPIVANLQQTPGAPAGWLSDPSPDDYGYTLAEINAAGESKSGTSCSISLP